MKRTRTGSYPEPYRARPETSTGSFYHVISDTNTNTNTNTNTSTNTNTNSKQAQAQAQNRNQIVSNEASARIIATDLTIVDLCYQRWRARLDESEDLQAVVMHDQLELEMRFGHMVRSPGGEVFVNGVQSHEFANIIALMDAACTAWGNGTGSWHVELAATAALHEEALYVIGFYNGSHDSYLSRVIGNVFSRAPNGNPADEGSLCVTDRDYKRVRHKQRAYNAVLANASGGASSISLKVSASSERMFPNENGEILKVHWRDARGDEECVQPQNVRVKSRQSYYVYLDGEVDTLESHPEPAFRVDLTLIWEASSRLKAHFRHSEVSIDPAYEVEVEMMPAVQLRDDRLILWSQLATRLAVVATDACSLGGTVPLTNVAQQKWRVARRDLFCAL